MNLKNDFSFFTKRIDQPNIETDYFQIFANNNYVDVPRDDDLKGDAILLKFEQRVWKYNIEDNKDNIQVFNSFYNKDEASDEYFMHDIYYTDASNSTLENPISCLPTLSFRTLLIHEQLHAKFGLPIYFGRMVRIHPIRESLTSMYISDCIVGVPKKDLIDFFQVDKCYYYNEHTNYSVSHRRKASKTDAIPFGNYFNKALYFTEKSVNQRFEDALELVSDFLSDYNSIVEYLHEVGVGLEIHGQNLLVYVDSSGNSIRRYLYRDLGNCTISPNLYNKNGDIDEYYQKNHKFDFQATGQVISVNACTWQSFRIFVLGFLFYNLDKYQIDNDLNFDVYKWGNEIIERGEFLKNIY